MAQTGFECRSGLSKEISIHFEPGRYYDDTGMIPQCYKYHIELWISLISTPCVLKKANLAFNISFVGAVGHQKTWFLLVLKSDFLVILYCGLFFISLYIILFFKALAQSTYYI